MKGRSTSQAAIVLACLLPALAACGGSGGSVASVPGPVSAPPPPPTPAPIGNRVGGAVMLGEYSADGTDTLRSSGLIDRADDDLRLEVDGATKTYTVTLLGYITKVFSPETNVVPAQATDELGNFLYFRNDAGTGVESLEVLRRDPGNERMALQYTSYGLWTMIDPHAPTEDRNASTYSFVFGEPTDKTALPTTGTASYQGIVDGYYGTYRLRDSTGTLTADFAEWTVSTELSLRTDGLRIGDDPALTTDTGFEIGTLSGTGDIGCSISCGVDDFGADHNAYWGSLGGTLEGNAVSGSFDGLFFGPNAEEAGFSFEVNTYPYEPASGSAPGPSAAGVFVGKQ